MKLTADLEGLISLGKDEDRRQYTATRRSLLEPENVPRLIAEVNRSLRQDLERAEGAAATALWLAEEIDDDAGRGLGHRARGNVLIFRRDYEAALAEYRRALDLFGRTGSEEEEASTRNSAAACLGYLGRLEEALDYYRTALDTFTRVGNRLRAGRVRNNLGWLLTRQDRFREALEHYRAAYEIFQAEGEPADLPMTLRNIAVCLQDLNDFDASLEAYEQARIACETGDVPLVGLEVSYNIAYLHYLRGEYSRANRLFDEARATARRLGDRHHSALADLDQAEIFLELNLTEEADRLAELAHEAFRHLGMAYEAAKAQTCRALAAYRRGKAESAIELLALAGETFEGQGNEVWAATVDLYRALVLFEAQNREPSSRLLDSAYRRFLAAGLPTRTALCEILQAQLALAAGDAPAAKRSCAAALARLAGLGAPALEAEAHLVVARTEESLGRRGAALDAYRRSHATLEGLRSHLGSEEAKIAFLKDKLAVYEGLVELTLEDAGPGAAEEAFGWVEKAKSRSLADLLAFGSWALPTTTGEEELVGELRRLRERLNWHYHRVDEAESGGSERSTRRVERLRGEIRQGEDELLRILRRLQTGDPDFRSLQDSLTVRLDEIRATLPPDTALLEYYIARDSVYAFLVDGTRLEVERVASATEVRRLQSGLQMQLRRFLLPPEHLERVSGFVGRATQSYLTRLHAALLGPFAGRLEARQLVLVPHGLLHFVPFHALHDGERYLIDRCAVSYAPSATVLHLCSRRPVRPTRGALVLGVPDERAPQIRQEVEAVAESLTDARLLVGADATQESLERYGESCRYLHLATHGLHRRDNPMFSALRLSAGRLSLFDLYGLKLNAELVVLSGCGTGLSVVEGADELVGLTRGLLYAGAQAVVVTLWDVNDDSAARYMRHFYGRLTAGAPPAEALRQAMQDLRETDPHPYHWAPFMLVGRPAMASPSPAHAPANETGR